MELAAIRDILKQPNYAKNETVTIWFIGGQLIHVSAADLDKDFKIVWSNVCRVDISAFENSERMNKFIEEFLQYDAFCALMEFVFSNVRINKHTGKSSVRVVLNITEIRNLSGQVINYICKRYPFVCNFALTVKIPAEELLKLIKMIDCNVIKRLTLNLCNTYFYERKLHQCIPDTKAIHYILTEFKRLELFSVVDVEKTNLSTYNEYSRIMKKSIKMGKCFLENEAVANNYTILSYGDEIDSHKWSTEDREYYAKRNRNIRMIVCKSVLTLLMIRKYRNTWLNQLDKSIVLYIAKLMYEQRYEKDHIREINRQDKQSQALNVN